MFIYLIIHLNIYLSIYLSECMCLRVWLGWWQKWLNILILAQVVNVWAKIKLIDLCPIGQLVHHNLSMSIFFFYYMLYEAKLSEYQ